MIECGTLQDLAEIEDMPSLPSLRRFIDARPDFPLLQRGRNGKPFVIDLAEAAAFVRANWSDGRTIERRRAKRIEQIDPLPLFEGTQA